MTPEEREEYNEAVRRSADKHYDIRKMHKQWLEQNSVKIDADYGYSTGNFIMRYVVDTDKECIYLADKYDYEFKSLKFCEIIGAETKENGDTTGSLGNAILGGLVAGAAGAIVGSNVTHQRILSYDVIIYTKNIKNPQIVLGLIDSSDSPTLSDSAEYRRATEFANEIYASIKAILANQQVD